MADSVPSQLKKLRKRAGLSLDRLAKAAGYSGSSSIQRYFEDDYGEPTLRLEIARRFARALAGRGTPAISEAEVLVLAGLGSPPAAGTGAIVEAGPGAGTGAPSDRDAFLAAAGAWPRDVPMYGVTVGGADGDFVLNAGQIVDYARRPPALARRNVFALYVQGASMSPWRQPGNFVYLDPVRPPRFGERVVVECEPEAEGEGHPAYLKELVAKTAAKVRLRQYNPESTIEIALSKVRHIHRVIEWEEVLGI